MPDEPMNLPGEGPLDPKPERNTTIVVKDPTKQSFWRFRNIALLVLTAVLPATTGWIYNKSEQSVTNYFNKQKSQDERIRILEEDTRERLKELENDHANNKAIWDAIAEERTKQTEQEIELRVLQRIVDHEFRRSIMASRPKPEKEPSTTPGETPAELFPPLPVPPQPLPVPKPAPRIDPDRYRLEQESKFPKPAPNQQKK
jgi:hypothetical protein